MVYRGVRVRSPPQWLVWPSNIHGSHKIVRLRRLPGNSRTEDCLECWSILAELVHDQAGIPRPKLAKSTSNTWLTRTGTTVRLTMKDFKRIHLFKVPCQRAVSGKMSRGILPA